MASSVAAASASKNTRLSYIAALVCAALALGFFETLVPLPMVLPGLKLGLANIAIIAAVYLLNAKDAFIVALVKVLITGVLFGSPITLLYSGCGALVSFAGMAVAAKAFRAPVIATGIVGAIFHNAGQLVVACLMLHNPGLAFLGFPLLLMGLVFGLLTGVIAKQILERFAESSSEVGIFSEASENEGQIAVANIASRGCTERRGRVLPVSLKLALVCVSILAGFIVTGFVQTLIWIIVCLMVVALFAPDPSFALKPLRSIAGLALFVFIFDVAFHTTGNPIVCMGPIHITDNGLAFGLENVLKIFGICLVSCAFAVTTTASDAIETLRGAVTPFCKNTNALNDLIAVSEMTAAVLPLIATHVYALRDDESEGQKRFSLKALSQVCAGIFSDMIATCQVVQSGKTLENG